MSLGVSREATEGTTTATSDRRPAPGEALTTFDGGPRLRHQPALDGLRGVAAAVVVVFHLNRLQGGFLGVDLFFVLSGFLITSLLAVEHSRSGRIQLARFWARRARRLLPALFVLVGGVAVLLVLFTPGAVRADFRGSGIGTLLYAANWERMGSTFTYWDSFRQPSPFDHTWSLAIEEQFYLVWPLVTVAVFRWLGRGDARRGTRSLAVIAVVGAIVSFIELWVLFDPVATNRAYFGTDTRIGATLVGAALAAVTLLRRPPQPVPGAGPQPPASVPGAIGRAVPTLTALAGLAGGAWMAICVLSINGLGASYYEGGLISFALAAALVIHATNVGPDTVLARALSLRPLCYLGLISYGVYLWHWPVIVYMTPERMPVDGLALDAVRVATTLGVAALSYHLVEMPIRRGALRPARAGGAAVAALAVTLAAVMVVTVRPSGTVAATMGANGTTYPGNFPYHYTPATIPAGALRVLLVGDSGAHHLAPELVSEAERKGGAVESVISFDCSVVNPEGIARSYDGQIVRSGPGCNQQRLQAWEETRDRFRPDVVVYYLANAGGLDEMFVDGEWQTDCDRAYDQMIEDELGREVAMLGGQGAAVMVATSPYNGFTILYAKASERVDCRNATYRRVAEEHPRTGIVELSTYIDDLRHDGISPMQDVLHLNQATARRVSRWLWPQLLQAVGRADTATAGAAPGGVDG